jgi:dTDP-4-amino-4,6-dideoxygalactose transaminase
MPQRCSGPGRAEAIRDLREYDERETYTVRYNYKMTDLQAALCENRLKRLPIFLEKRKKLAAIYSSGLDGVQLKLPFGHKDREHIYYRYAVQIDSPVQFMDGMHKRGIICRRPVFKPIHRYLQLPGFPNTDEAWEKAVSIPLYPVLKQEEAYFIIDTMKSIL